MCLGSGPLVRLSAVPQLDFDEHRTDGLPDHAESLFPALSKTGLADSVFSTPPTNRCELLERGLELTETMLEGGRRVRLPQCEESK